MDCSCNCRAVTQLDTRDTQKESTGVAVIAVYSVKGGVGKTTIAVDLAWRAAVMGSRNTLLWDLDIQGGAGFMLGRDEPQRQRAAAIFQREGKPRENIVHTAYERLSLLQADESLRNLPGQLARLGQKKRLATMAAQLRGEFDRIVLDCPPVLNEISDQIIAAADILIVPLPPSPLAFRALDFVRRELTRNHLRHPPILPILSMYNPRRQLHRDARYGPAAEWPIVPLASQLEQSAVRRAPIGSFANGSAAGKALDRLSCAIENKLASKGIG